MRKYKLRFTSQGDLISVKTEFGDPGCSEPSCSVRYLNGGVECESSHEDFLSALRAARKFAAFDVGSLEDSVVGRKIELLLEVDKILADHPEYPTHPEGRCAVVEVPRKLLQWLRRQIYDPIGYASMGQDSTGKICSLADL